MTKLALVRKSPVIPVKICYLAETPGAVPGLVKLFQKEWEPYYGPEGPGIAEKDIWDSSQINSMPLALVAVDENGAVIGTGSLNTESVGSEHYQAPGLQRW